MKKFFAISVLLLVLSSLQVMAQGVITYGSASVSTISAENPIAIFTFQGTEGDQVTIQAIGITPDLELSASLQSGTAILATADSDPFTAGSTDARIDLLLPSSTTYLILVTSTNGGTGDFLLKLSGQALAEKTIITGIPAEVPINAGESSYYSFEGSADAPTTLNFASTSPDLQFLAVVRNSNGQIISTASGASALISVTGEGAYEVTLSGVTGAMSGIVSVTLADTGQPPAEPTAEPPDPVVTEEVTVGGECLVSSDGAVNIRSGPTTNTDILAQMQPGQSYVVNGVYTDWYRISVGGAGNGWVFNQVVTTSGDCSAIPQVSADAPPPTDAPLATDVPPTIAAPTQTLAPTATVAPGQPTATFTPSYTPTVMVQQATATFTPSYTPTTPPAAQIAPEDARFNNPLTIPLDNTASVLDFVSYPDGDTEDRVRWDITGMNQNSSMSGGRARLVISVSCFGEGTDQIQFFTGGQTYSCGSTIVDTEVTAASKTGSVVITAVGGTGTYVQWVLTGTATRVN